MHARRQQQKGTIEASARTLLPRMDMNVCMVLCIDMSLDMSMDICWDSCINLCMAMCMDIHADSCIDTSIRMCEHMPAQGSATCHRPSIRHQLPRGEERGGGGGGCCCCCCYCCCSGLHTYMSRHAWMQPSIHTWRTAVEATTGVDAADAK